MAVGEVRMQRRLCMTVWKEVFFLKILQNKSQVLCKMNLLDADNVPFSVSLWNVMVLSFSFDCCFIVWKVNNKNINGRTHLSTSLSFHRPDRQTDRQTDRQSFLSPVCVQSLSPGRAPTETSRPLSRRVLSHLAVCYHSKCACSPP